MTLPAPRRGRTFLLVSTAAAVALVAGSMLAAQQPPSGAAPSSETAAPAKKAPAKAGAAKEGAAKTSSPSYSVGVSMGEQLRASGIPPDLLNAQQLAQGVHDALSGKASMTDKDRENLRTLVDSVGESNHRAAAKFLAENGKKSDVVTTASGLQYKVLTAGSGGASPKANDEVTVNYRGTLMNGTEFDSSYKRGQPANFQVSRVIPGWTEALGLMKPGAKWQLFIPPQLAYDLRSAPPIPPGSLLIFEVELLSVKPAPTAAQPGVMQPGAAAQPATPPPAQPPK